ARLGDDAVQPLAVQADHRPERASSTSSVSVVPSSSLPPRPAWLLPQPIPLRGFSLQIVSGPERIESGWWDGDVRRDYYIVQTREGQRAWAFTAPGQEGPLMLQGWFA
ncbi:MAG TPA: DNA polymerase Y family protein, partial [Pseudoxanthomonas sp.]|nr:DNA polymerase Y family protein [Pseudoxanthomonas sp.]